MNAKNELQLLTETEIEFVGGGDCGCGPTIIIYGNNYGNFTNFGNTVVTTINNVVLPVVLPIISTPTPRPIAATSYGRYQLA